MIRQRGNSMPTFLALLLAAGCASGGTTSGGADPATAEEGVPAEGAIVQIYNTASSATRVMVYMRPEVGVDIPLGMVEAGERKTFPFDGQPGRYTLRAVGDTGTRTSRIFEFYRNSQVRWDMNINQVRVGGRR